MISIRVFDQARGEGLWIELWCSKRALRRTDSQFDGDCLIERVLLIDFTCFPDWQLYKFEAMTLDQSRPTTDGFADKLRRRDGPVKQDVVAVLRVMDTICTLCVSKPQP